MNAQRQAKSTPPSVARMVEDIVGCKWSLCVLDLVNRGMLGAMLIGLLMGLLMSFVSVNLRAVQGISGIGLYLFGLGLSSLLFKRLLGSTKAIDGFQAIPIPFLSDLPYVGDVFFKHNALVYVAFALVPVAAFVLNRTTLGLKIRAAGMKPEAADSLGVSVAGGATREYVP